MLVLHYGYTTWTVIKCLEKNLDGNYMACRFKQIQKAAPYKTVGEWPLPLSQTILVR